jgi:hypothetical protein
MNRNHLALLLFLSFIIGSVKIQAQWVQTGLNSSVNHLINDGTNIYCGTNGGIFKSTNNGKNWENINNGFTYKAITCLAVFGSTLFVGTMGDNFTFDSFRSTDNGANWTSSGLVNIPIRNLIVLGEYIFAGTDFGIYRSSDNGSSWTGVNNGLNGDTGIFSIVSNGSDLFACSYGQVYLSTNYGDNWTIAFPSYPAALIVYGKWLFAVSYYEVRCTSDKGLSWAVVDSGLLRPQVLGRCVAYSAPYLFIGTDFGVFLTSDNGVSWYGGNSGLFNRGVHTLCVSGTNLLAGTNENGLWSCSIPDMIISVKEKPGAGMPSNFSLEQNYPNPFNPSTAIKFSLPYRTHVSLIVYDALGKLVNTLVDEELNTGNYTKEFMPANLASGVYLYKLQTPDVTINKKMIFIK